jgi:hypothetical protein
LSRYPNVLRINYNDQSAWEHAPHDSTLDIAGFCFRSDYFRKLVEKGGDFIANPGLQLSSAQSCPFMKHTVIASAF